MKKLLRGALAASLCGYICINGLGCGGHDDDDHVHAPPSGADTVIYEGGATDEALGSIVGVTAKADDTRAAALLAPTDGAVVPREPAPTFSWSTGTASASPRPRSRAWSPFEAERSAHAHGVAVTGVAYYLVLSTPKTPKLVEVLTTAQSWQPDAATWAKITAEAAPVTATLITARLEENRLAADGGPFARTKALTFTVAP